MCQVWLSDEQLDANVREIPCIKLVYPEENLGTPQQYSPSVPDSSLLSTESLKRRQRGDHRSLLVFIIWIGITNLSSHRSNSCCPLFSFYSSAHVCIYNFVITYPICPSLNIPHNASLTLFSPFWIVAIPSCWNPCVLGY